MALGIALAACDAPAEQSSGESNVTPQSGEFYSPMAPAGDIPPGSRGNEGGGASVEGGVSGDLSGDGSVMGEPGVSGGSDGSMGEDSPGGEAVTESELPTSDVPPPSRDVFVDEQCEFEDWVGKPVDEAAIKATDRPYRILKPDSMMTMDHSPSRINVEHGDDGVVTRVWCG